MTTTFDSGQVDWTEVDNRLSLFYEDYVRRVTAGYPPELQQLLLDTEVNGIVYLGGTDQPISIEGQEPVQFWSKAITETTHYLQHILVQDYGLDQEEAALYEVDELGYSTLAQSPCKMAWVKCPGSNLVVRRCCG